MARRLVFLLFSLILPSSASAQHYCYEPNAPSCLSAYGTFDDQWSFDSCFRALDDYQQDVVEFSECLGRWVEDTTRQAQKESDAVVEKYQSAIEYWNCMADHRSYCPRP
jgi:hypothetical protein